VADILLVHWNEKEGQERTRALKLLRHKTRLLWNSEKPSLAAIRQSPPDLFLIDLACLPSHGREVAGYFRRMKSTRNIPILFVSDDPDRAAAARKLIPDANFGTWEKIQAHITNALANPPKDPVVPGTMAGYSGSPLPKKLGIRDKHAVVLLNPPDRFERRLEPLPSEAQMIDDLSRANVVLLFAQSEAQFVRDFRQAIKALPDKVALWIAWPKKASGVKTDVNENLIREFGLASGWVDYKICAIDETWSGLCFARRKK
jgi:hypothetical protein